jgi:prolipoprotein diacylglyceryltransferase
VQPLGSFPAFYGSRRFITEFARAVPLHLTLVQMFLSAPSSQIPSVYVPSLISETRTSCLEIKMMKSDGV